MVQGSGSIWDPPGRGVMFLGPEGTAKSVSNRETIPQAFVGFEVCMIALFWAPGARGYLATGGAGQAVAISKDHEKGS